MALKGFINKLSKGSFERFHASVNGSEFGMYRLPKFQGPFLVVPRIRMIELAANPKP